MLSEITFQTPDEAKAWDMYVSAVIAHEGWSQNTPEYIADAMIRERRKRMAPDKAERDWIAHNPGDPMPCDGDDWVVYKLTDGLPRKTQARNLDWLHTNEAIRIAAWRPAP